MQSQWITILVLLFGLQGTKQTNEQMKPTPPVDIEKIPSLHYKLLSKQAKAFLPVYAQYTQLIQTKGMQGLKEIVSSDFALRGGEAPIYGQKAINQLDQFRTDFKMGEVSVRVRQLIFKRDIVIASTAETIQLRMKNSEKPDMIESYGWSWKQTWRKTAKDWKLVSMERETREIKEDGMTFVFTSPVPKK